MPPAAAALLPLAAAAAGRTARAAVHAARQRRAGAGDAASADRPVARRGRAGPPCALALLTSALLASALLVAGCRPAGDDDGFVGYRMLAMATWVELTLPAGAVEHDPGLVASIQRELGRFERDYYAWGDGELAALNRALTESGRFEASAALAGLLETSQRIAVATGGTFEPGVGTLVELWGFHQGEPSGITPDDAAIAALLAASGRIGDLAIDGSRISVVPAPGTAMPRNAAPGPGAVAGPGVAAPDGAGTRDGAGTPDAAPGALRFTLDLGGIAKGAAVDRIVALLESAGVEAALVNAGGDLRVIGARPDRAWRVGIAAPRGDGVLGAIALEPGEAAFTSGDYERYFEQDGQRLHHILDPRTGRPVGHTRALTVVASEGTLADAAATALFVAGPGAWREQARALGIEAVLRVDASGAIEMTEAMRDRFQPGTEAGSDIIAAAD